MAENPFVEEIVSLRVGEISELVVEQNEFFQSRDAWIFLPDCVEIVGETRLNGRIIYCYQREEKQSVQNIAKFRQKALCKMERNDNLRDWKDLLSSRRLTSVY